MLTNRNLNPARLPFRHPRGRPNRAASARRAQALARPARPGVDLRGVACQIEGVHHKADPDSPEGLAHRLFLLERERERLVTLKASSERDRDNAFKMFGLAVLAVPAGVLWGFWIALALFVQVVLLVIGTWYITGVHILEYTGNIADCDEDLRVVRALQTSASTPKR